MLIGEVRDVEQVIERAEAFTIGGASVIVTGPDGETVDTGSPEIPAGSATSHTLSYRLVAAATGVYTLDFQVWVGDEILHYYQQIAVEPSPFAGIYPWIRRCLQDNVTGLLDTEFDRDIRSAIRELLAPFTGQTYTGLDATDRERMDEAVGLAVAARLHTPLSTGGANSAMVLEKTEQSTRQFAQISDPNQDERLRWEREARYAFAQISFVAESLTAQNAVSLFQTAGRRQAEGEARNVIELAFGRVATVVGLE